MAEMGNLKETDTACYEICNLLHSALKESSSEYEMAGNIFAAFFHDLVVHFTGIIIHRAALQNYGDDIEFPWVNKVYASAPFHYRESQFRCQLEKTGILSCTKQFGLIPLAMGQSIPLGYRQKRILDKALKVFTYRPVWTDIYLPKRAAQLDYLQSVILELCKNYEIEKCSIVQENWARHVRVHSTDKQAAIREKGVLVGTRNNLHNRKLALNYLQQEKEVVGFTHGEITNDVLDEPVYGYSDKTLCTTLVEYGTFASTALAYPAIIPPQKIVRRSSPAVKRYYRPSRHIPYRSLENSRVLLIPTMYQLNHLYGPKHAYESEQYYQWHRAIEGCTPNLTIKIHPKTRIRPRFECEIDYRQLEICINEYDVLILDYFATSTVLAMFSDKPVIYFDIGLRTLEPEFYRDLEKRCTIVNIDFTMDWEEQIQSGIGRYRMEKKVCSNTALAKYALCDQEEFSMLGTIFDIIRIQHPVCT